MSKYNHELADGDQTPSIFAKPVGKSRNPDFQQVTLYIRKDTRMDADYKLAMAGNRQDLSELVEQLLSKWTYGEQQKSVVEKLLKERDL